MTSALDRLFAAIAHFFRRFWAGVKRHPFWALASVPVVVPALAAMYVMSLVPLTPSTDDIKKAKSEQPTVVLSADGKELAVFKRANRDWVKLADVSPHVLEALIATEDRRFFEHGGLDLRRIASAALRTAQGDLQGGSTITQQLARNLYPEEIGRSATITRKVKEAITALKIEKVYTKDEILETYLNTVPFLYNAYGIELAARTYFDKPANKLDVLESATLIGMLKGTSYYNPVLNPERAVQRRNLVLAQLVKSQKLPQATYEQLKGKPLGLDFERQQEDLGIAPHLAQQLRRWLISWADQKGYNIYADGLVVRTTVDSRVQTLATEALTRQADKLQTIANSAWRGRAGPNKELLNTFIRETSEYRAARQSGLSEADALKKILTDTAFVQTLWQEKTTLQAGFLAIEPGSGHVRAWVGSRDFKQDQFDHVQQARRQPGSTFKPFVYGAAFEQGIHPSETLIDQAMEFRMDDRTVWKPTDMHDATGLPTTLRDGLIQSKNTITAQLMQRVGAARVAQVAQAMGVRQSKLDPVPSLSLGTSPVTLKEMVSAYGTIANGGSFVEPVLVTRVENRAGEVIEEFHAKPREAGLAAPAALTLLDVMRGVIDKGTGTAIRTRFGIQGDVAGKTGTTQDNTDGWFILMHPQLVAGAWVGFNDNRITMGDSWGQGSRNALNIVGDFFQQSTKARMIDTKAKFAAPKDEGLAPPMSRMNEWLNSVFQSPPAEQQPAVVAEPPPRAPVFSEPAVVIAPPSRELEPPRSPWQTPQRTPEFQWTPERERDRAAEAPWYPERERQRSSEAPSGPAFTPAPPAPQRPPQLVIRVPEGAGAPAAQERREQMEMGAGPAVPDVRPPPERSGGGGFRILREVRPEGQ
jgi:penicillin-binding protein 1A